MNTQEVTAQLAEISGEKFWKLVQRARALTVPHHDPYNPHKTWKVFRTKLAHLLMSVVCSGGEHFFYEHLCHYKRRYRWDYPPFAPGWQKVYRKNLCRTMAPEERQTFLAELRTAAEKIAAKETQATVAMWRESYSDVNEDGAWSIVWPRVALDPNLSSTLVGTWRWCSAESLVHSMDPFDSDRSDPGVTLRDFERLRGHVHRESFDFDEIDRNPLYGQDLEKPEDLDAPITDLLEYGFSSMRSCSGLDVAEWVLWAPKRRPRYVHHPDPVCDWEDRLEDRQGGCYGVRRHLLLRTASVERGGL